MKKRVACLWIPILSAVIGCNWNEVDPNPEKAILGKWETIQIGNESRMTSNKPGGYMEFLRDSVSRFHDYNTGRVTEDKYYWEDSLLYIGSLSHRVQFPSKYLMRLDIHNANAIFYVSIHRRIR